MIDPIAKDRINTDLALLSTEQQRQAADLIHSFRLSHDPLPPPVQGKDLLHLAGTLDDESALEMIEAVRECRQVDPRDR